ARPGARVGALGRGEGGSCGGPLASARALFNPSMDHTDHVRLIRDGVVDRPGVWADLGSGGGAFTLALADLLGAGGSIVSVDRDRGSLEAQRREMERRFPQAAVDYRVADFAGMLDLPELDGLLTANSLHFVREKEPVLR